MKVSIEATDIPVKIYQELRVRTGLSAKSDEAAVTGLKKHRFFGIG